MSTMTKTEKIDYILEAANKSLDLPVLGEQSEAWLLGHGRSLLERMPDRVLDVVLTVSDGLEADEVERLRKEVVELANKAIDVKYVPEAMEELVLDRFLTFLFEACQKGLAIVQK